MYQTLRAVLTLVDRSTRWRALAVASLVLFGTALETMGIALIFPFISFLIDPNQSEQAQWLRDFLAQHSIATTGAMPIALAALVLAIFVVKNLVLVGVYFAQSNFNSLNELLLSQKLFGRYLKGEYVLHLTRNSAELIRNLTVTTSTVFGGVFMSFMTIGTELCVVIAVSLMLLIADPIITLAAGIGLAFTMGVFYHVLKLKYVVWGEERLLVNKDVLQVLQQGLHSIKEIKVLGIEDSMLQAFLPPRRALATNQAALVTMNNMPRLWVETVMAVGVMSVVIVVLANEGSADKIVATLSLFAAAALRLIPSMNRILIAMNAVRTGQGAVRAIAQDMKTFVPESDETGEISDPLQAPVFAREIRLSDIGYTYPAAAKPSLTGIDLTIAKGESIGLVGPSGAGKTTLADVILGLLKPTRGQLLLDGVDISAKGRFWRHRIGYVPQSIYLFDDTIRKNIAFGIDPSEIDDRRIEEVVGLAQLNDVVNGLPAGLDTVVGERGIRLSGGQRQRIGIARALYRDPDVLVFDEATSALDNETEREIQGAINAFAGVKTIIVIAHRLSTVRRCDRLVFMRDGAIASIGTFDGLMKSQADFRRLASAEQVN